MGELIKIQEHNGNKAVSARELYEGLGFDISNWAKWYKKNITDNQFALEGEDYIQLVLSTRTIDFALSIDFAKKLSMMARTEAGEKIRQYFIEVEKRAKEIAKPLTTLDFLEYNLKLMREQEQRVSAIESKVLAIEAKTATRPDYYTIIGYATINNLSIGLQIASKIGGKAARICKSNGYLMDEVPDPRFGRVRSYPKFVLEQVFNDESIMK